ncbi:ArsA-related P-loop ATPase [Haloglycomyces albus]|uniref:ArsA-related P-loop ATPase n=1 Tax=Haloglycomyces albus TaxID=526067 RepID=UPI00046D5215|nr:ArsA-related P-loop ATPase [Haloglycomyces albus]
MRTSSGPPPRLHFVTGKGGSGKTTLAASLALALADAGKKILLVELEDRQEIATTFGIPPLPYGERLVTSGLGGGEVYGLSIDIDKAFLEYLEMYYHMGYAGKVLRKAGAVDFATTVAPGLKDILLTGKIKEITSRSQQGRWSYDAVVVDAPPSGRITRFLNVTVESKRLAKTGPIGRHSRSVAKLLHSPETAVHIATLPTAMSVQESLDTIAELRGVELPVGAVMLNRTVSQDHPEVDDSSLRQALNQVDIDGADGMVEALTAQYERRLGQVRAQREYRDELARRDIDGMLVPELVEGVDAGGLYRIAEVVRQAGEECDRE